MAFHLRDPAAATAEQRERTQHEFEDARDFMKERKQPDGVEFFAFAQTPQVFVVEMFHSSCLSQMSLDFGSGTKR